MIDERAQKTAAQAAPEAPAQDGGTRGGDAAATDAAEPISHNGPMACHIGHIRPQPQGDGCVTVEIFANHVRIKRPCHAVPARPTLRGKVNGLSARAGRRLRWAIENTPELIAPGASFVCLTYPEDFPKDGRQVKRDLAAFGKRCRREGISFAWALEYQTRGAPHFHLLARFPEAWDIVRIRGWVALSWFEVVGSGDEKHLRAGTSAEIVYNAECAGWYISHYLGKEYQKIPPEGVTLPGRMWGMIGCRPTKPEVLRFPEGSKVSVDLVRLIRRWASSDFAFRQRVRFLPAAERKSLAKSMRLTDPDIASALLDFRNCPVTAEVPPEDRKSWSPHDPGREKGFSVRNAAKVARQLLEITSPPF